MWLIKRLDFLVIAYDFSPTLRALFTQKHNILFTQKHRPNIHVNVHSLSLWCPCLVSMTPYCYPSSLCFPLLSLTDCCHFLFVERAIRPIVWAGKVTNHINPYSASHDNWYTVGGDGGCRVGEVRAGTTYPMPDHKGFNFTTVTSKFSEIQHCKG